MNKEKVLTKDIAELLLHLDDGLGILPTFTAIEDAAAEMLSTCRDRLSLGGLETLTVPTHRT